MAKGKRMTEIKSIFDEPFSKSFTKTKEIMECIKEDLIIQDFIDLGKVSDNIPVNWTNREEIVERIVELTINKLKSSIQKEFDELNTRLIHTTGLLNWREEQVKKHFKTIKELEDKLKEQPKQIFDDIKQFKVTIGEGSLIDKEDWYLFIEKLRKK